MKIEMAPVSGFLMTYDEAVMYCFLCTHNGHKDWRIPDWHEYTDYQSEEFAVWDTSEANAPLYLIREVMPVRTILTNTGQHERIV